MKVAFPKVVSSDSLSYEYYIRKDEGHECLIKYIKDLPHKLEENGKMESGYYWLRGLTREIRNHIFQTGYDYNNKDSTFNYTVFFCFNLAAIYETFASYE